MVERMKKTFKVLVKGKGFGRAPCTESLYICGPWGKFLTAFLVVVDQGRLLGMIELVLFPNAWDGGFFSDKQVMSVARASNSGGEGDWMVYSSPSTD